MLQLIDLNKQNDKSQVYKNISKEVSKLNQNLNNINDPMKINQILKSY